MSDEIPRLSPSIAKKLLRAPSLAYKAHRLLGGVDDAQTDDMVTGSILERLITGFGADDITVVDALDWRTKDAREQRETAKGPCVLAKDYDALLTASNIIKLKIASAVDGWFDYENQVRFEWQSHGCHCSGVVDQVQIRDKSFTILDLKKIQSAHPADIQRAVIRYGYDIQHAAYIEAVESHYPHLSGRGNFYFVFFEAVPPYCVTIAQFDGSIRTLGRSKWNKAKSVWNKCLASNEWPDYTNGEVITISAKPYDLEEMEDTTDDELDEMFCGQ